MSTIPDIHTLMAIRDLSLAARLTIDGFMTGINKSKVKGPGLEFSQYRSYQPGDDLRWLDWKRYARSDRYYIRESEIETSINIRILIDASRSMAHTDDGVSKMDYARLLAASLGWLANQQGDALGLYVFQDGQLYSLPARKDPQHLARFYHQLEGIQPGGKMGQPVAYQHIFTGQGRKELLLLVTDLYEEKGEISRLLELLASMGHELVVFHLMAGNELKKEFGGYSQVQDLETGQRIPVGSGWDEVYQQRMEQWLAEVRSRLLDNHIAYQLLRLDQPLDQALRNFLKHRQQITG